LANGGLVVNSVILIISRFIFHFTYCFCRGNENDLLSSDEKCCVTMQSWIHSLVPLVIDCWVESGLNTAKQCKIVDCFPVSCDNST